MGPCLSNDESMIIFFNNYYCYYFINYNHTRTSTGNAMWNNVSLTHSLSFPFLNSLPNTSILPSYPNESLLKLSETRTDHPTLTIPLSLWPALHPFYHWAYPHLCKKIRLTYWVVLSQGGQPRQSRIKLLIAKV